MIIPFQPRLSNEIMIDGLYTPCLDYVIWIELFRMFINQKQFA